MCIGVSNITNFKQNYNQELNKKETEPKRQIIDYEPEKTHDRDYEIYMSAQGTFGKTLVNMMQIDEAWKHMLSASIQSCAFLNMALIEKNATEEDLGKMAMITADLSELMNEGDIYYRKDRCNSLIKEIEAMAKKYDCF